jgi:hypothetical protein
VYPGGLDQPLGRAAADHQMAAGGEPDEPGHAERGQPGGIGELRGDQPADPGAEHVRQRERQPREAPVKLAQQLILHRRPGPDPPRAVSCPGSQLHHSFSPPGDRHALAGQQQVGDRLQVDGIGLDPPAPPHPALLCHMRRVELQQLPASRPDRLRQQRPVIMTGRLHPDPYHGPGRQHLLQPGRHRPQRRGSHRELSRPEQPASIRIGRRQRDHRLPHIDRHSDRR